mmetsp:Transcript_7724/g.16392  ORF Transcript_7724/g.16392 Transcript_7724/m.16392 type:complete len:315 (-) Transcript_7724:269-1213(-)
MERYHPLRLLQQHPRPAPHELIHERPSQRAKLHERDRQGGQVPGGLGVHGGGQLQSTDEEREGGGEARGGPRETEIPEGNEVLGGRLESIEEGKVGKAEGWEYGGGRDLESVPLGHEEVGQFVGQLYGPYGRREGEQKFVEPPQVVIGDGVRLPESVQHHRVGPEGSQGEQQRPRERRQGRKVREGATRLRRHVLTRDQYHRISEYVLGPFPQGRIPDVAEGVPFRPGRHALLQPFLHGLHEGRRVLLGVRAAYDPNLPGVYGGFGRLERTLSADLIEEGAGVGRTGRRPVLAGLTGDLGIDSRFHNHRVLEID